MNRTSAFELYQRNPRAYRNMAVHRFDGGIGLPDFSGADWFMEPDFAVDVGDAALDFGGDWTNYADQNLATPSEYTPTPDQVWQDQVSGHGAITSETTNPPSGGLLGGLERAGKWMQKNPTLSMMGLGLGLGSLQALQSRSAMKRESARRDAAERRRAERQALMDNPPRYQGMDVRPSGPAFQHAAVTNPLSLREYGQRPELRFFDPYQQQPVRAAEGGMPVVGGLEQMMMGGDDEMSMIDGEGGGQDDNVPAMLSPSEYVMDADVVAALGDGNPSEGARKLDEFRERIRRHKRGAPSSKIPPKAKPLESYLR